MLILLSDYPYDFTIAGINVAIKMDCAAIVNPCCLISEMNGQGGSQGNDPALAALNDFRNSFQGPAGIVVMQAEKCKIDRSADSDAAVAEGS